MHKNETKSQFSWVFLTLPFFLMGLGSIEKTHAQVTSSSVISRSKTAKKVESQSTTGSLGLYQTSFISPDYQMTSEKNFQLLSVDIRQNKSNDPTAGLQLSTDLSGLVSPNNQALNSLNVRELYLEYGNLSLGRRIRTWSQLESYWPLGLYQPQYKWNPLLPQAQGLTGMFLELKNPEDAIIPMKLSMMGSFIFVPDQQSQFQVRDGKFQSVNPWFRSPPTSGQFDDQGQVIDQFNYEVEIPPTQQVVFRRSFVAQLKFGKDSSPVDFNVGWAAKPSNQLALGAKGFQQFNNTTQTMIRPQVFEHSLLSSDLGYFSSLSWTQIKFGVSAIREKPTTAEYPIDYTYNTYEDSLLISPYLKFNFTNIEVWASYLDIQGGDEKTVGPQADRFKDFLPQRYPYKKAYQGQVRAGYNWSAKKALWTQVNYLTGVDTKFSRLWTKLEYQFESKWKASVDLFLVQAVNNTLYSQYENNDYSQVGVSYVF